MLLKLDFSTDVPIYRQIHDQIVMFIAGGYLNAGEKLPTIRALANEAGVNMMTINKAYHLLKQEGHIYTDRRGGTMVARQVAVQGAGQDAGQDAGQAAEQSTMQIAGRAAGQSARQAAVTLVDKALSEIHLHAAEAKLSGMSREKWLELCGTAFDHPGAEHPE